MHIYLQNITQVWIAFIIFVVLLMALDLLVAKNTRKHDSNSASIVKKMAYLSLLNVSLGLGFGLFIYYEMGSKASLDYITGYLIEKSLSFDNLMVISMIFINFKIKPQHQHRILFWGVLGVLVMRGLFIAIGCEILHRFEKILLLFGVFLIISGFKMLKSKPESADIKDNIFIRLLKKRNRIKDDVESDHFFVREDSKLFVTKSFLAMITVECMDLVFAIDSIPAIFSITTDPIIVYTSNVFAILGLRALYFVIIPLLERFHYFSYAVSLILIFIGIKVTIPILFSVKPIHPGISLGVTLSLLLAGIIFSELKRFNDKKNNEQH